LWLDRYNLQGADFGASQATATSGRIYPRHPATPPPPLIDKTMEYLRHKASDMSKTYLLSQTLLLLFFL
jgi:hypothetical protein